MVLDPMGNVQPCCWLPDYHLGNIKDQTLKEIWNSSPIQKLRREFIEGKPQICKVKMDQIGCHRTSLQKYSSEIKLSVLQEALPMRFDLRLNGQCNLQCVMCNIWEMPNGLYTEESFWRPGREDFFRNLKEMIVLGGEPFIQKDVYRLISEVSALNPNCEWGFITNGHYDFNEKIVSYLEKIKIRYIQVSLDSLDPELYSEIRKGGRLSRALQTLQAIINYSERRRSSGCEFVVSISMCVQKRNYKEIEAFISFSRHLNLELGIQFVAHPLSESLLSLSFSERKNISEYMEEIQNRVALEQLNAVIAPLRESLNTG